jgi:hypothetical protein
MARKKAKYKKIKIEVWKCGGCEFEWSYRAVRCPLCSTSTPLKII